MDGPRLLSVTVSRQTGSGGSYIGYLVAQKLGLRLVDREILHRAAERLDLDVGSLEHYEERASGLLENIMRAFAAGAPEMGSCMPVLERAVYDKDLFAVESKVIRDIADRYGAVIIGRGGFHVLKGRPDVIHVFIHAPEEFRVKRIMAAQKIGEAREARAKIREYDRRRAKFARDIVGVEWTDARNFHLCIDSALVGLSPAAEMIAAVVRGMADPA
jgi:cytidylate kinase